MEVANFIFVSKVVSLTFELLYYFGLSPVVLYTAAFLTALFSFLFFSLQFYMALAYKRILLSWYKFPSMYMFG